MSHRAPPFQKLLNCETRRHVTPRRHRGISHLHGLRLPIRRDRPEPNKNTDRSLVCWADLIYYYYSRASFINYSITHQPLSHIPRVIKAEFSSPIVNLDFRKRTASSDILLLRSICKEAYSNDVSLDGFTTSDV